MNLEPETIAIILSIASFVGVIGGPIVANIMTARMAANDRKEARRLRYWQHLIESLNKLIEIRGAQNYRELTGGQPVITHGAAQAFGRALGIIQSINDKELRELVSSAYDTRQLADLEKQRDLVDSAIRRLGEIIAELSGYEK